MNNIKLKKYNKYIPLGDTCYIAKYLKSRGIRQEAYPFDWLISNIKFITYLLQDEKIDEKMDFIFQKEKFGKMKSNKINHIMKLCIGYSYISGACNYGKVRFYHDFYSSWKWEYQILKVKEKYSKRLNRLNEILKNNETSKIFITWTQKLIINDYKILGDKLIERGFDNFDFLICIRYRYIRNIINLENCKKINLNNYLYEYNYDKYKIYLLLYKDLNNVSSSLNYLLF